VVNEGVHRPVNVAASGHLSAQQPETKQTHRPNAFGQL
jgi:hypothetical protein